MQLRRITAAFIILGLLLAQQRLERRRARNQFLWREIWFGTGTTVRTAGGFAKATAICVSRIQEKLSRLDNITALQSEGRRKV